MNDKITRRVFLGAGTATLAVAVGQLGKINEVSAQTKQLNLYSSRHYNTDRRLYDNFTRQTGIKVNLVEGEADPLIERIKSEGSNSPADILLTVDAGRLWRADQQGIFAPSIPAFSPKEFLLICVTPKVTGLGLVNACG